MNTNSQNNQDLLKDVFKDADGSGVPDIFEEQVDSKTKTVTKINLNGIEYTSWDDVPQEFQHLKSISANITKTIKDANDVSVTEKKTDQSDPKIKTFVFTQKGVVNPDEVNYPALSKLSITLDLALKIAG